MDERTIARFWSRVDRRGPNDCWEWTATLHHCGYGRMSVAGRYEGAHRISWRLAEGAIPKGYVVMHRCDRKACVNPRHLELGTIGDNARDWSAKGRAPKPSVKRNPPQPRLSVAERFWSKVDRRAPNECWPWLRSVVGGYGYFWVPPRFVYAHRYSWSLRYGAVPAGLCVLHSCDNRSCVNPRHLRVGTKADNVADMLARGRGRTIDPAYHWSRIHPERVRRGQGHPWSRLDDRKVRGIRRLLANGWRRADIQQRYGVSRNTVARIANGSAWDHVKA